MPVKIRLTRTGKKKQPSYRVVVMDSRKPRDGKYIEQIGRYDARQDPSLIEIDNERALDWLHKGAQPTERAQKLLEISGAWAQFRVDKGEIHTIADHEGAVWPEKVHVVGEEEAAETEPAEEVEEGVSSDELPAAGAEEEAGETEPEAQVEEEVSSDELAVASSAAQPEEDAADESDDTPEPEESEES